MSSAFGSVSGNLFQRPQTISLRNTDTQFFGSIRNIGFIFDNDLTLKQHIIKTCTAAYIEIGRICLFILKPRRAKHAKPHLKQLYWLPLEHRSLKTHLYKQ